MDAMRFSGGPLDGREITPPPGAVVDQCEMRLEADGMVHRYVRAVVPKPGNARVLYWIGGPHE